MHLILPAIVLAIAAISPSSCQCPFTSALRSGQLGHQLDALKQSNLIAHDYLIDEGDPAYVIWQMVPLDNDTQQLYSRSDALVQAQQFYLEQYQRRQSNATTRDTQPLSSAQLWQQATTMVALDDRCRRQPICDPADKYVQPDGACNNLRSPNWGRSFAPYGRLLAANYDDGIFAVRRSRRSRAELPSPRRIGNVAMQHSVYSPAPQRVPNHGSLLFGQYVTHDTGFKDIYQNPIGGNGLRCCAKDNLRVLTGSQSYANCMAMEMPIDDPFYSAFGGGCVDYIRSQPVFRNDCNLGPADQASSVTQHLDHSTIYGSTAEVLKTVRSFVGGRLLTGANDFFPRTPNCTGDFCYFTGDARGAFYPTLSLWHSIFMRYHNHLADGLAAVNRQWRDEQLFQEARRLNTAVYQNVVFNEWLPLYLGEAESRRRLLSCPKTMAYCGEYLEGVDPSNMQEFANGVFRLFHSNTPHAINMYDAGYNVNLTWLVTESIHGAEILRTQYLGMMRGFFKDPILMSSYPNNIRNQIFQNFNVKGIGFDLLSIDIQRGRDNGVPPYYVFLEMIIAKNRRRTIRRWQDLQGIFSDYSIARLQQVYENVVDVDLLVGLLLEEKHDSLVGPVSRYLLEEQFYRAKYGNRFHYSFAGGSHPFTADQISAINRMRFADVLCQCSDIELVPERVFEVLGPDNRLIPCSGYVIELSLWQDSSAPTDEDWMT